MWSIESGLGPLSSTISRKLCEAEEIEFIVHKTELSALSGNTQLNP
jgi:hypothetical protein